MKFEDALSLKEYLKTIYNCPSEKQYYKYLREIDFENAFVIESIRFLINDNNNGGGCDHLRMAVTIKKFKNKNNVLNLDINKFNKENYEESLKLTTDFLFSNKLNIGQISKIIQLYENDYNNEKNHITKNKISKEQRSNMIKKLKSIDPFSKILNEVCNIYNETKI